MYWVNCQAFFLHRWMISDRLMLEAWISDSNVRFCIKSQERKMPVIRAFIVDIFQILFIQLQETMSLNQSLLFFVKIANVIVTITSCLSIPSWVSARMRLHLIILGCSSSGWKLMQKKFFYSVMKGKDQLKHILYIKKILYELIWSICSLTSLCLTLQCVHYDNSNCLLMM